MNSTSRSAEPVSYESRARIESESMPGVAFTLAKISFARRLELARRVREVAQKIEFLDAGTELKDKVESSILGAEIDRMYLDWGLVSMDGLLIDGEPASTANLVERGPETLTREIIDRVRAVCHLSEDERKN